jgi:3'(2'), 5'-bisphosphate nucleotidase
MVGAESLEKGDKSPVTVADFGSQALVCQHIKATFPHDPIVGEEDSTDLQQADNANTLAKITQFLQSFHPGVDGATVCEWIDSGNGRVGERFWTLDPIDGTKGFLRNDQYAVALALIEHGEPQVAVLACPALPIAMNNPHLGTGVLFLAVRGEGASMAPLSVGADLSKFRPIQVTRQDNPLSFRFAESVEAGHGDHERQQAIAKAAGITQASLRMDSQAKYGAVARGDAVLYLRLPSPKSPNYREKIWDHAAGALIVQEAGGMVTDMHGKPLDFSSSDKMEHNQGVVVSNGTIHAAVIAALSS